MNRNGETKRVMYHIETDVVAVTPTHLLTEMKTTNVLYCFLLSYFQRQRVNEQRG